MILIKKYFVFIFAFSFLSLSFLPNIYEASVVNLLPKDRTMVWGEYNYTYDYNVYLSKIRQGQEGRFSVVDKYDNHPQQKGIFLVIIYLISGKIGSIFNFTPTLTYHLLRVVTSVLWISTIIFLNIYFLKKISLINLGVVLSFLTASFPIFYRFQNQLWVGQYMGWWQELDILKRISFIPHDTMNYIFISAFTVFLSQIDKNKKYFPLLCGLLFISVFIQPTSAVLFAISWSLHHVIKFFWFKSLEKDQIAFKIKQTAVIFISIFIPLLYIKSVTSSYPWKSLLDFDQNNRLVFNIKDYLLALGPVFFTGVIGGFLSILKKKQELLSLITWIIGVFILIFLFKFFPFQSELRFVQTSNHIPLAILSVYLFYELWKSSSKHIRVIKIIIFITVITIIINGLVQGYFSLKSQTQFVNQRALATLPLVPYPPQVMYPLTDFYNGLKWLEKNTDQQTVVLSKITAGNYIPAYSGNFVYLGHGAETPNFDERTKKVDEFFSGNLEEKQAQKFLKTENINYVFYGPQEKENSLKDIAIYPFLKPIYQSPLVVIYRVNK